MLKTLSKITRTTTISHHSNPWIFVITIGISLLFVIIIFIMESIDEHKQEERFDEIHYQSENFRLLNRIVKESMKFYKINRFKNTIIFLVAILACFFGLYTIAFKSNLLDYIFGTISEFISATFFWIYKQCQKEEKYYYDRIYIINKQLLAIQLIEKENKRKKSNDFSKIIDALIDNKN